jgi:hypothetical protein
MLTKEQILNAKPRMSSVFLPVLGGEISLRAISLNDRDALEVFIQKARGNIRGIRARMLRLCACDADGKPLFAEQDETALSELDSGAIEPAMDECMRLCGLRSQEIGGEKA